MRTLLKALAWVVIGCGSDPSGHGAGTRASTAGEPRSVQVVAAVVGPFTPSVELAGEVSAGDQVVIAAQVDGVLTAVIADLGATVARNQVLARIDATDFMARQTQAQAELAQAQSSVARLERLVASEMVTPEQLDVARTRVAVTQAQATLAARQVRDATIRAPFAGLVARRDVSPGAFVRVGAPLFELVGTDSLRVVVDIPERQAPFVQPGSALTARALDSEQALTISRVAPAVDRTTRTLRVEADLPAGCPWRPGTFAMVSIVAATQANAARLPSSAVFSTLGRDRVVVVRNGRAEIVDVERIGQDGEQVVVIGVGGSDQVVLRSGAAIVPGAPLTVRTEPEATAPSREEP